MPLYSIAKAIPPQPPVPLGTMISLFNYTDSMSGIRRRLFIHWFIQYGMAEDERWVSLPQNAKNLFFFSLRVVLIYLL